MKIDSEEQDDRCNFFELEEALAIVDKMQIHVVPANEDEALCNELLNLPSPKVALARTG